MTDLNEQIAVKLFGKPRWPKTRKQAEKDEWKGPCTDNWHQGIGQYVTFGNVYYWESEAHAKWMAEHKRNPDYENDDTASFLVVDEMLRRGWHLFLHHVPVERAGKTTYRWCVDFQADRSATKYGGQVARAWEDKRGRAICLAALEALKKAE